MYAGIMYIPLIVGGAAAMWWGLLASHRIKAPLDILAALVCLAGVITFALGILLTVIPTFFR